MPRFQDLRAWPYLLLGLSLILAGQANAQQTQPAAPVAPPPAAVTPPVAPTVAPVAPATVAKTTASAAELEARLLRVERVLDNQVLLEMLRSLDQMQAEVRELRGEIEQQTHELDVLKQRQRDLYLDSDRRLRELEIGAAAAPAAPVSEAVEQAAEPQTPSVAAPQVPTPAVPTGGGIEQTAAAETDAAETPAAPADPAQEREAYTAAFDQLKAGRYQPAINAFKEFLGDYPEGRYAANAQYWLGEANYVSRNFSDALEQFRQVLSRYPASPKVADARLKIGYTYYELEEWDEARRTLEQLVSDYPNSSVARLAQQRIIRLKNEGH